MTVKGLVPAPPDCKWQLRKSWAKGYDFQLALWHTWDRPDEHGVCFDAEGPVEHLVGGFVPREADLYRVSKRLVRKYYAGMARNARIKQVLEEYK